MERHTYNIVVMGYHRVGKTALIKRFIDGSFPNVYIPTVEDNYIKEFQHEDVSAILNIIDTGGNHAEFPAMRDLNILQADKIMLIYEYGNLLTFTEIANLYFDIKKLRMAKKEIPIVFVGNKIEQKIDLNQDANTL